MSLWALVVSNIGFQIRAMQCGHGPPWCLVGPYHCCMLFAALTSSLPCRRHSAGVNSNLGAQQDDQDNGDDSQKALTARARCGAAPMCRSPGARAPRWHVLSRARHNLHAPSAQRQAPCAELLVLPDCHRDGLSHGRLDSRGRGRLDGCGCGHLVSR